MQIINYYNPVIPSEFFEYLVEDFLSVEFAGGWDHGIQRPVDENRRNGNSPRLGERGERIQHRGEGKQDKLSQLRVQSNLYAAME